MPAKGLFKLRLLRRHHAAIRGTLLAMTVNNQNATLLKFGMRRGDRCYELELTPLNTEKGDVKWQ